MEQMLKLKNCVHRQQVGLGWVSSKQGLCSHVTITPTERAGLSHIKTHLSACYVHICSIKHSHSNAFGLFMNLYILTFRLMLVCSARLRPHRPSFISRPK